jgi:hypothetical protein
MEVEVVHLLLATTRACRSLLTSSCAKEILEEHTDNQKKSVADRLFERVQQIKESDGQTMIGTEIVVVFLKRLIQPVMS